MELFATDRDRLAFLLETDAVLNLDFEALEAQGRDVSEELLPEIRPKYITNCIGISIHPSLPRGESDAAFRLACLGRCA